MEMVLCVLRDYKCNIKTAFKRLYTGGSLWIVIYPASCMIESIKGFGISIFVIFFFGLMLSRMYPNQLEKTMLLCPLTQKEKQCYVRTGYRVRILMPMSLYLLLGIYWLGFAQGNILTYLCIGICFFLFFSCVNMHCIAADKIPELYAMHFGVWEVLLFIIGVLEFYFAEYMLSGETIAMGEYIFLGILSVVQVLFFIKFRESFYAKIMESAIAYENYN